VFKASVDYVSCQSLMRERITEKLLDSRSLSPLCARCVACIIPEVGAFLRSSGVPVLSFPVLGRVNLDLDPQSDTLTHLEECHQFGYKAAVYNFLLNRDHMSRMVQQRPVLLTWIRLILLPQLSLISHDESRNLSMSINSSHGLKFISSLGLRLTNGKSQPTAKLLEWR
jgi:hypothetical protein